jgi:hypothetical protein
LPDRAEGAQIVIVDEVTPGIETMLATSASSSVWYLSSSGTRAMTGRQLMCAPVPHLEVPTLDLFVPVNPLAARHRHHGFGFTGYVLVLPDPEGPGGAADAVQSIGARFEEAWVVVVEGAVASAWRGQALRGKVSVDTRMDLLRLFAHAQCVVDLGPGSYVARECVEALRLGTPIVVPAISGPAAVHANAGGGEVFANLDELVDRVAGYQDEGRRSTAAASGRLYANEHYGDPGRAVASVQALLDWDDQAVSPGDVRGGHASE